MKELLPFRPQHLVGGAALLTAVSGMTSAASAAAKAPARNTPQKPHLVLIMTDQQTADAMSCAGCLHVNTPAMDALAADGVRMTRGYCSYPLSGPSRASLITGRMPSEVGASDNDLRPHDEDMANGIGHVITAAGYESLYAGKWHVPEVNIPQTGTGFKAIAPMHDPSLAEACDKALSEYDRSKPLFLVASLLDPHEICEYGRFESLHYGQLEPFSTDDCPNLPRNFMPSTYEPEVLSLEKASTPRYHDTSTYSEDDWRRYMYAYYRLVERADREVGRIVDVLKKQGIYDDALIIFCSDHGDGVAAHHWNQKWALFEECVNIPLIIKAPKGCGPAGAVNDTALSNIGLDIYATLCDYAGATPDTERLRGMSLRGIAEGRQTELHDDIFIETVLSGAGVNGWAVIAGDYKYVLYQWGRNREALYDLRNDRGEMLNLTVDKAFADKLAEMRRRMYDWGVRTGNPKLTRNMKPYAR